MRNLIAFLALLASAVPAMASTDCTSSVASITVETGNDKASYVVAFESGASFALLPNGVNYKEIAATVSLANAQGRDLTARFAADGVDCRRDARRIDLIAIILRQYATSTTTTLTPPPYSTDPARP